MKRTTTSIIALLFATLAFAQLPNAVQRNLKWHDEINVLPYEESTETTPLLRFDGGIYKAEISTLPLYTERFELPSHGDFRVAFANMAFEPLTKTPSEDDATIAEQIALSTTVEKDRGKYYGRVTFMPIRKSGASLEKLVSFELRLNFTPTPLPIKPRGGNTYTSVLADGDIYKFSVEKTGVHKLDFDFLKNKLGLPLESIDPRTIKIYGNGGGILPELADAPRADDLVENAIQIVGEDDGTFDSGDYILFYGQGADIWYFDNAKQTFSYPKNFYSLKNFYFIKAGGGNGLRIQDQASLPGATYSTNTFSDFVRHENEKHNLLHDWIYTQGAGRQFFSDYYKVTTEDDFSEELQVPNIVPNEPIKLSASFAARIEQGGGNANYVIIANGKSMASGSFGKTQGGTTDTYASIVGISDEFAPTSSDLSIQLKFNRPENTFNEGWLDYIELNLRRQLTMVGDQLQFRDTRTMGNAVSSFNLGGADANLVVWDITDPLVPKHQLGSLSGTTFSFGAATDTLVEFIAFGNNGFLTAEAVGKIENQNFHGLENVDMAIVYHKDFAAQAERLAEHRRTFSGLNVATVDVEKLYNEFSSGRKDATAMRDFARMLYDRNPERFKAMLLFGDASFDSRDIYKFGGDYVPTLETPQSVSPIFSFPTDDYFTLLSDGEGQNLGTGSLDIAVGRIPVKDESEAKSVVDKIIRYDTDPTDLRDWRNRVAFVGDDEDGNLHTGDADSIARKISAKNPNLNLDKIYLDAYPQLSTFGGVRVPLATDAINNNIFKGVLAMIYLGHGGTKGWTQERVLKIEDILSWRNLEKMPIIITATCSFAGYDDPTNTTAGELCMLHQNGGAIALYTTTRPVFASSNADLTEAAVDTLFYKLNNERPTIGEVLRLSKNKQGNTDNTQKFTLLGDPMQKLALPNQQVITTSINGHAIDAAVIDTIRALQKVTIEGEVHDDAGQLLSNFDGVVYPTIYDKSIQYRTLGQGTPLFDFDLQKNVIFKGRASVTGGKFKFTFVVPKDIDYNFGSCKLSYYAADEGQMEDASGNYKGIIVGGTDPNALADDQGPKVEVFMNDESFVFGGITSPNPVLFVKLADDNGINVIGNSVGHDLAGILDKNSQNTYNLNDFYEAALDDYTKGEVRYPFHSLAEGRHEIKVQAWDIANNPAEGYTEFVVANSEKVALEHVLNYPNPFTTSTYFMFEHNQAGTEMDVMVQIYSISGKLIKTLEERIISTGYRLGKSNGIQWDGRDDYGDPLAKGVYLYKVKVRSANTGNTVLEGESDFEKLVILK
ncbi:MAG: type IX secretion system sortase PorU [Saprospiraceae bacterium]|nr:type IX secretion system sortase PorU [Saprospiraceae bacterium]